ncbi:MAG: hypothetical protein ACLP4V_01465 [Methylocella sp.]
MKTCLRLALVMGIGLGGLGSTAAFGSAMPLSGLDPALATAADTTKAVENTRWICGPYGGCQWVPGWRRYGWWGPGYGYRGPWRWGTYEGGPNGHRSYWGG